ncbi:MAG TPA: LppX_LprAFG lipoprotein [Pseudonocardiaceae bacterium]|jgi:lipoprotein LprG|nr:LppX_LprAFG lipoprotein [Pseudonocardiaceae bacterium]
MRRIGIVVGLAVGLVGLVAGCSSGGSASTANLPAASTLLASAGTSMASVTSVHFSIVVNGTLAGVPIQNADGDLNAQGNAKGNAKVALLGQLTQVDFVLVNKIFYLKGPTGGYQKIPASLAGSLFDPSAILDPNRGIAKILTSVQGGQTQAKESVNGTDCYKITGKVGKAIVSSLIPGISVDVDATLWVAADSKNLPVKASFAVPGSGGSQGATVDVTFSNVNAPVTVTAPAS